jgi:hypothetical protein
MPQPTVISQVKMVILSGSTQKTAFFDDFRPAALIQRRFLRAAGLRRQENGVFQVPQRCGVRKTAFFNRFRPAASV